MRKKIKESSNVTKVQLYVMLILPNMIMKSSNIRKKNKGTIECDKSIVTCNVDIAQYENDTIKCVKKKREPPNVIKV